MLCVAMLWQTIAWAQVQPVSGYTFTSSVGAYAPITGGTAVTTAAGADDTSFGPYNIGFSFYFGNTTTPFTQFTVNSNGFIALGAGLPAGDTYTSLTSVPNAIAAFNTDLQTPATPAAGDISYVVTGTAPNRVLTIQWNNFRRWNVTTGDSFNFQISLYETSNMIQTSYGVVSISGGGTANVQTGMTGNVVTDFNNRTTTTDWAASTAGGTNAANMLVNATVFPASGLNYQWWPTCSGGITASGILTLGSTSACASSAGVLLTDSGYSGIVNFQVSTDGGNTWSNTNPTNQTVASTDVTQTITVTATSQIRAAVSCGGTIVYTAPQTFTLLAPAPTTITPSSTGPFCNPPGANVTLQASSGPGYTFLWNTNETTAAITVTPTATTNYSVTATDGVCVSTAAYTVTVTQVPTVTATASPSPVCQYQNVTAQAVFNDLTVLRITEVTAFHNGTGATNPYPPYIIAGLPAAPANEDMVEITNLSNYPVNAGGLVYEAWVTGGTAPQRTYTIPAGTIIPPGATMVLLLGSTGTAQPANLFFLAGGTNNVFGSATAWGSLIKSGTTIIDAVGLNSFAWPAASTVTSAQWSGNIASSSGVAGVRRTVAADSNTAADWTVASAANLQNFGTLNSGLTLATPYTFAWDTGATTAIMTDVPSTTGTVAYTVTVTDAASGCGTTATTSVTVTPASTSPTTNSPQSRCGTGTVSLTATSGTLGTFIWYASSTATTALQTDPGVTTSTYSPSVSSSTSFWVTFTDSAPGSCPSERIEVIVNVTTPPTMNLTPNPTGTFCNPPGANLSITADALAGYTYLWSNAATTNAISVTPTATTTYTVTATDGTCTNIQSYTVTVTNSPLVAATATSASVCSGANDVLSVNFTNTMPAYCALAATNTVDDDIASVSFGSFTNNSPGWPGAATGNASSTGTYTNYTALNAGYYTPGSSYTLTVTQFNSGISYTCYTNAFFDWNRDGDFADAGETVNMGNTTAGTTVSATITIPTTAASGPIRMRIVQRESGTAANTGPCAPNTPAWGEVEDYTIVVNTYTYAWSATTTGGVTSDGLPGTAGTTSSTNYTVTATPTASGSSGTAIYTVTVTDAGSGCTGTASYTVTVNLVSETPIASANTRCGTGPAGVSATTVATGTFSWYNVATGGTALQTDPAATSSTYTGTVSTTTDFWVEFLETGSTCPSPRVQVTQTVDPAANITITPSATGPFCNPIGATLDLTASADQTGYAFVWDDGSTNAVRSLSNITATTTYTVTATAGVCTNTASYTVVVSDAPSVTATATPSTICSGANSVLGITLPADAAADVNPGGSLPTGYCAAAATSTADDDIGRVQFSGGIDNVSSGYTIGGPQTPIAASNQLYNNYTASVNPGYAVAGSQYTITVTQVNTGTQYDCYVRIFADWNQDGDFADAGESYNIGGAVGVNSYVVSGTITVPTDALPGNTVMRVALIEGGSATSLLLGCGTFTWGEVEDYAITVSQYNYAWSATTGAGITSDGLPGTAGTSSASNANVTVTPTANANGTATYTVTVTNPTTGCTNTSSVVVNVQVASPTPTTTPSSQCGTNPANVQAETLVAGTFTWYDAATGGTLLQTDANALLSILTTSTTSTTSYWVEFTETGSVCPSPRLEVIATITPSASVDIAGPTSSACSGTVNETLTASSVNTSYTYTWSTSETTAAITVTPTTTTTYTVTATDGVCSAVNSYTVTVTAPPSITAAAASTTTCSGQNLALSVSPASYLVSTPAFFTETPPATTNAGPTGDDAAQGLNNIGFNFTFFGTTFTQFGISTNGYIQLGATPTTVYDSPLPVASPANIIALAWNDLVAPAGSITWWVTGTPGSQRLVVNYNAVTGYATTGTVTGQIILEEGTNNIYLSTVNHNIATSAAQGISANSTSGIAVPGRNSVVWPLTANSTYLFTPALFSWTVAGTTGDATGGLPGTAGTPSSSNSSVIAVPTAATGGTVTYEVSTTDPASGCVGTSQVTVTVNQAALAPIGSPSGQCGQGQASLIAQSDPAGTAGTFNWYTVPTGGTPVNIEYSAVGISFYLTPVINTTTDYYVEFVQDGNACPSPRTTVTATVSAPPTIDLALTPDPAIYCSSDPQVVTIAASSTASPAYVYAWSPTTGLFEDAALTIPYAGGNVATVYTQPTTTITYTVTGTSYLPDGITVVCQNTATATVSVNPSPLASIEASATSLCLGESTTLSVTPNNYQALRITEVTLFRTGTGATSPYPGYIGAGDADFVEITNLSSVPVDVSGLVVEAWTSTTLLNSISIPSGTILPPNGVMVVHVGAGTDVPASFYFNMGGSVDNMFSSLATGVVITFDGVIIDAVAANSYVWPAASGVTATDWSGNVPGSGGFAGISRTASTDSNTATDWSVSSAASPQTIGTLNAGLSSLASYSILWSNGSTAVSLIETPTSAGAYPYTVTVTSTNGCSATATTTINVYDTPTAPTAPGATYCGAGIRDIVATSTAGAGIFNWYDQTNTLVYTEGTALAPVSTSTYSVLVPSTRSYFVEFVQNGCASPQTQVTITVSIAATISIAASPSTASCSTAGTPYTLTASSAAPYTYTWTYGASSFVGNPLVFTPTATTNVTVTGFDSVTGCSNVAVYTVNITAAPQGTATAVPSTVCSGGAVSLGVSLSNTPVIVTNFCTSAATQNTLTDNIANVTFAGINNNSTNYPAGGALNNTSANQLYTNYTSVAPATVQPGSTYPFSVTQYQTNGYYGTYTTVHIDWNHNNIFDASETYNIGNTVSAGTPITANITVPLTALGGPTLMRVKMVESGAANQSACGSFSYGEVEDYIVLVNPYTYVWTATATGDAAAGLPAGAGTASAGNIAVTAAPTAATGGTVTYTVVITDSSTSCTNSSSVTVAINPLPTPPSVPNPAICGSGSVTLTTADVAAPGGVFTWYDAASGGSVLQTDGTTAVPVVNSSYVTPNLTNSTSYWVTYTDANGCTSSARQVDVTVTPADPIAITAVGTNPQCSNSLSSMTLTVANTATSPVNTYAYIWSTGETTASITVNPSTTTVYTVTASDANTNCNEVTSYTVTVNPNPVVAAYASPGSLCEGGSSNLSLTLDGGSVTVIEPGTPTYCTATANNSSGDFIANVTLGTINNTTGATGTSYYNDFTAQSTTLTSGGTYTISLQVGTWGSSNYIGAWIDFNNNGLFTDAGEQVALSGSLAGNAIYTNTFTVPTIGGSGTVRMRVREVYSSAAPPCNNPGPASFGETEDYSINLVGSAYSFVWSNGVTTAGQTVTPAVGVNTYTVTVTNNGCSSTASTTVTVNPLPVAAIVPSTATINCTTPTANLMASGGGTYLWSNGGTTAAITASATGTYTVTVTSADGCTATASAVVSGSVTPPNVNGGPDRVLTCTTPSATLTAISTTTGATFVWSNGTTTTSGASITVTAAGTYTVVATDPGNSCTASDVVLVTANQTTPTLSLNTPSTITCATTSTTLTATSNTTQLLWSNGATTASISVTAGGTYSVTATNLSNGCTSTASVVVLQDTAAPNAAVNPSTATLTCAAPAASLLASGGGTYLWNTGATTAAIVANIAGTYTVTVTGTNGCTATASASVSSNTTPPSVNAGADQTIACGATATLSATGTGSFTWSTGATTAGITTPVLVSNTTYTVTVTGANGCTASDAVVVNVLPCCAAQGGVIAVNTAICPGDPIVATVSGQNADATNYAFYYLLVNPATGAIVASNTTGNFAGVTPGNYVVYGYSVKISAPVGGPNPPANGTLLSAITGSCFDLSNTGAAITVPAPFPPFAGSVSPSQGTDGGISPYAYNTQILTLSGGTLPYNFTWNNTGYVRYDIVYGTDGVVTVTILYADNAQWAVTVTDSNGCGASNLSFSNTQGAPVTNPIIDIDSYTITANSGTTTPNGTVNITVSGGGCTAGQYTYQWSGPNGFTATTEDITGLISGWYNVTVTCPATGQTTTGWYWVPTARRGRTKVDFAELSAFPNPFETSTHVEFSVGEDGHAQVVVFAIDGKQVAQLYDGDVTANGIYTIPFEANNLPSGVYVVKLTTSSGLVETTRLILAK